MKTLIYHPNEFFRQRLVRWLESKSHAVLHHAAEAQIYDVAKHEPDLVLLPAFTQRIKISKDFAADPIQLLQWFFQDCAFLEFPPGVEVLRWHENVAPARVARLLAQAEKLRARMRSPARGYSRGHQAIYLDNELPAEAPHTASRSAHEKACRKQKEQFLNQLQTACCEHRHERAKEYLRIARRYNRGMQRETSFYIAYGTWKISEIREQIGRWATVLAHYVSGIEIEHCPAPQGASERIKFLHGHMPDYYYYPVACIIGHGISPTIRQHILDLSGWGYSGQARAEVAQTGCALLGLCTFLEHAAESQVAMFEQFLDLESAFHVESEPSRALRRAFGICFGFWGWDRLVKLGPSLRLITRDFHASQANAEASQPPQPIAPTYNEFTSMTAKANPPPEDDNGSAA